MERLIERRRRRIVKVGMTSRGVVADLMRKVMCAVGMKFGRKFLLVATEESKERRRGARARNKAENSVHVGGLGGT